MNDAGQDLLEARAVRNAARSTFDTRLSQVKADLAARSVGGRVADKVTDDAMAALDEAIDVAKESKGIIAGTAALLALWFLRNPIVSRVTEMLDNHLADNRLAEEEESTNA